MSSSDTYFIIYVIRFQPPSRAKWSKGEIPINISIFEDKSTRIKFDIDTSTIYVVGLKFNIHKKRSLHREWFLNLNIYNVSN